MELHALEGHFAGGFDSGSGKFSQSYRVSCWPCLSAIMSAGEGH